MKGMTFNAIGTSILGSCGFKDGGDGFLVNFGRNSPNSGNLESPSSFPTKLFRNWKQFSLGCGTKISFFSELG